MGKLRVVLAGGSFVALLALGLVSTTAVDVFAQAAKTAAAPVDINSASLAELEKLPGIGEARAKKIIANRPYQSVADLSKSGLPKNTIDKITPMVTAGSGPAPKAAPAPTTAPATPATPAPAPSAETKKAAPTTASKAAASSNEKVWVNTDSKVYHKEGDRWYGKTKDGKYMTEAEAVKEGYRAAKEGGHRKKDKDKTN
jgi:Helix-hairpin-helix motif